MNARSQLPSSIPTAVSPLEDVAHIEGTPEYYARRSRSEATYKAYRADINDFIAWSRMTNPFPTTPEAVAAYLSAHANIFAPSTLNHRVAALSYLHKIMGSPDPTRHQFVRAVLSGIRKDRIEKGWSEEQAPPFSLQQVRAVLGVMGDSLRERRDRAYFLVGILGAFRQSEMTALTVERLQRIEGEGIVIPMGAVKQDPLNEKKFVTALPRVTRPDSIFCPVSALDAWLEAAQITEGPIFRAINRRGVVSDTALSHTATNDIIQKWVARAGISDSQRFSGHSLRASFVTIMRGLGVSDALIARQTHHTSLDNLMIYDRPESALRDSPVRALAEALAADKATA